jgi:low affinity Fe/Cu permease
MTPARSASRFTAFAQSTSRAAGRPLAFLLAGVTVVVWLVTGPLFRFSDSWQLVINTGTTIVTFLMVFLIQNSQNRDSEALQIKLDELIRVTEGAHNALLNLEDLEERELDRIRSTYSDLARKAREDLRKGLGDTGRPDVDERRQVDYSPRNIHGTAMSARIVGDHGRGKLPKHRAG